MELQPWFDTAGRLFGVGKPFLMATAIGDRVQRPIGLPRYSAHWQMRSIEC